jgi:hypothetical protein
VEADTLSRRSLGVECTRADSGRSSALPTDALSTGPTRTVYVSDARIRAPSVCLQLPQVIRLIRIGDQLGA